MQDSLMQQTLEAFLERPTAESYRAARRLLLADPEYVGDPRQLADVVELCERGGFAEAGNAILEMLPDWALSPRLHAYAAWVADAIGDAQDAELEQFLQQACLEGLLATGDGTRRHPFLVMHVSDEYDILDRLQRVAESQRLVARETRQFDVLTADNSREYWFDVSDLLRVPPVALDRLRRLAAPRRVALGNRILRN